MKKLTALLAIFVLGGACTNQTAHIPPVTGFDAARYQGEWYEIARLPNRFEEGLIKIKADYRLIDGKLLVTNSGYEESTGKLRRAKGRGYFTGPPDVGELRVTFFWPFYGLYKIVALDEAYSYSLVIGKGYGYLWILSRSRSLPQETIDKLLSRARALGFDTASLIWTPQ